MVLKRLFGDPKLTYRGVRARSESNACCRQGPLMPRWRGPDVMEDDSLAMGYVCHRCGREYLPYQVRDRHLVG